MEEVAVPSGDLSLQLNLSLDPVSANLLSHSFIPHHMTNAETQNFSSTTEPETTPEVAHAIDQVSHRIIEAIVWTLNEKPGAIADFDSVHEAIDSRRPLENEAIALPLEDQLELIETHGRDLELSIGAVIPETLRARIQELADAIVFRLGRAHAHLEADHLDFLDRNELNLDQLVNDNPCGNLPHQKERNEDEAVAYEYDVDGTAVEIWRIAATGESPIAWTVLRPRD